MKRLVLFVAALVIAVSSQGCCCFDCCNPCGGGGGGCSPCGNPCGNSCGPGYGASYAPPPANMTPPAGAYRTPYQGPMVGTARPVSYSSYYGAQPSVAALPPGPLSTF